MTEQPLDLRRVLLILRRHRLTMAMILALGIVAGVGLAILRPPLPTSTAIVLLPPPQTSASGTSLRDMDTQIRIAEGVQILADAGRQIHPAVSSTDVNNLVKVSAPTTDLLIVRSQAKSGNEAQVLAQAVAQGYVDYSNSQVALTTGDEVTALQKQSTRLSSSISELQRRISQVNTRLQQEAGNSSQAARDSSLLLTLQTQESTDSLQRSQLVSQISTATGSQAVAGTQVFQKASEPTRGSLLAHRMTYGLFGLLIAFILGTILIVAVSRRGHRPRLRDEMAEAVGAPVLASLSSRRPKDSVSSEVQARTLTPDVMDAWSIRKTLEEIGVFDGAGRRSFCLSFITLDDDQESFSVGPQFALFLTGQGVETDLETNLNEDWVVQLRAMLTIDPRGKPEARRHNDALDQLESPAQRARVALTVVDRRQPSFVHPDGATITILVLSPGAATTTELARVALAAIDAGQRIDGVVVANPEPGDRTIGRLPQQFYQQPPRPNRMTGTVEERSL